MDREIKGDRLETRDKPGEGSGLETRDELGTTNSTKLSLKLNSNCNLLY